MIQKNSTINYYNINAQQYFDSTINIDTSQQIEFFCSNLAPNSKILDIGCGSGRDSLYFIQNGFQVFPIDASQKLAQLAEKLIQQKVFVYNIEDFHLENQFDAIWAMASLLHLPKSILPIALKNCVSSLKFEKSGVFFSSFKIGHGESYDEKGRFFSYYQPKELLSIFEKTELFENLEFTITNDKMGRENQWMSLKAINKPLLKNNFNKMFKK